MCGIFVQGGSKADPAFQAGLQAIEARGPEQTSVVEISGSTVVFGFTRLAIQGLNPQGMQPMTRNGVTWMCNGEIQNWKELAERHSIPVSSGSDCEILGPLYEIFHDNLSALFQSLDGVFSIAIADPVRNRLVVARDPQGVRPLQEAWVGDDGDRIFASEIKALVNDASPLSELEGVQPFPPGHYEVLALQQDPTDWYHFHREAQHHVPWVKQPLQEHRPLALQAVRHALEKAVQKRMISDRPIACLLSGGLDSSLIASLVAKQLREAGAPPLKTFSIGMPGSTDLRYARQVADWIGSDHTEVRLTFEDFWGAIPEVIRTIESQDTTTVRASVGNWLVSRAIRQMTDCKVVFNGDGSDEVWGSYLQFFKAPNDEAQEAEVQRLLQDIHQQDVLRSDRSISSHGLEARTPFLDKQFVATALSIPTQWRRPIRGVQVEKSFLREAFDDGVTLPKEVLWRKKEAFSDGVSSTEKSWSVMIQERLSDPKDPMVPSRWKEQAARAQQKNTPTTPEMQYYRNLFHSQFPSICEATNVPQFWMPRWCEGATDPSARTLDVQKEADD